MRAALSLVLLGFGQLCAVAMAQEQPAAVISPSSADRPIYITHVTVIDTETGKEKQDHTVVISGQRILEVRDSKNAKLPADAKVVDGNGKYLIPGLWDMHVHKSDIESTYPLYLANGVTGVRDMWGPADANKFRAELAVKRIDAPHLYLASPIVDGSPPVWPNSIAVSTADEARKVVDDQKRKGADFIKIYNRLSRESYFAIIDESRKQNIFVEGHVPIQVSAWEASDAKQKSFEHLYGLAMACSIREEELQARMVPTAAMKERAVITAEAARSYSEPKCNRLFARLKVNGNWQVPTLTVLRSFSLLNDPQFTNDGRLRYFAGWFRDALSAKDDFRLKSWSSTDFALEGELFGFSKRLVGAMFRSGVPLLAGTDTGNPYCFPGFSLQDELGLLVESGVSPLGALQAATRNAAIFMDATDKYGSVTPGKIADLVLLDADPLTDIHNTTKVSEVFLEGKEFDRAALDNMLRGAETAAKAAKADSSSSEAALRTVMDERRKASLEGNTDKIANSLADEYLQTDITGYVQDKTAWLNEYFQPLAELIKAGKFHWDVFDPKDVQIRMQGDTAIAIGTLEAKGSGARYAPTQHTWVADPNASFSGTLRFTHVYIKRNGKWLLAALHNAVPLTPPPPANK